MSLPKRPSIDFQVFVDLSNDWEDWQDDSGRIVYVTPACERISGYTAREFIDASVRFEQIIHPEDRRIWEEHRFAAHDSGASATVQAIEFRIVARDGSLHWIDHRCVSVPGKKDGRTGRYTCNRDITNRKQAELERWLSVELHLLINETPDTAALRRLATDWFQQRTGCEAVGLRLRRGEDCPYCETRGFPREFVELESRLCSEDSSGKILRDRDGNPVLECMCGNVISGRIDPAKPFFTPFGSFWTNCTTDLLVGTSDADRQVRTRNRCNGEGYESVALIPLRASKDCLGLLQLNDHRKNMFTLSAIALWERLAGYLAVSLAQRQTEESLRQSLAEKEVLMREIHHRVKNNLAAVIALLDLQCQSVPDEQSAGVLLQMQSRIRSIALVHERLYRAENMAHINFFEYLKALVSHLRTSFKFPGEMKCEIPTSATVNLDLAVPCGMIVNELVTNALRHAFPGGKSGAGTDDCRIQVRLEAEGTGYWLSVIDNGIGIPASVDIAVTRSLGLRLVHMLAEHQLGGTIRLDRSNGTHCAIWFDAQLRKEKHA
jgi:PAS domain S-box-containing protein